MESIKVKGFSIMNPVLGDSNWKIMFDQGVLVIVVPTCKDVLAAGRRVLRLLGVNTRRREFSFGEPYDGMLHQFPPEWDKLVRTTYIPFCSAPLKVKDEYILSGTKYIGM